MFGGRGSGFGVRWSGFGVRGSVVGVKKADASGPPDAGPALTLPAAFAPESGASAQAPHKAASPHPAAPTHACRRDVLIPHCRRDVPIPRCRRGVHTPRCMRDVPIPRCRRDVLIPQINGACGRGLRAPRPFRAPRRPKLTQMPCTALFTGLVGIRPRAASIAYIYTWGSTRRRVIVEGTMGRASPERRRTGRFWAFMRRGCNSWPYIRLRNAPQAACLTLPHRGLGGNLHGLTEPQRPRKAKAALRRLPAAPLVLDGEMTSAERRPKASAAARTARW